MSPACPVLTLKKLRAMPTLAVGQADDLKSDSSDGSGGGVRIWLSRCGVEDGEPYPNKVTVEHLIEGRWVKHSEYQAT